MNDAVKQAVRDGLTAAGVLVSYTDAGDVDKEIIANISHGIEAYTENGEPMRDISAMRVMHDDVANMTSAARFTLANGDVFKKKKNLKSDQITRLFQIGKV